MAPPAVDETELTKLHHETLHKYLQISGGNEHAASGLLRQLALSWSIALGVSEKQIVDELFTILRAARKEFEG